MMIGDRSTDPAYSKLADELEERIIEIETARTRRLAALGDPPAGTDPELDWQLPYYRKQSRLEQVHLYLHERSKRPLMAMLKAQYLKIWGPKATFSYFFPEHTFRAISWRAYKRMQADIHRDAATQTA